MDEEETASRPAPPSRGYERASESLIERMKGKGRTIEIAHEGTEEIRYLDWMCANANVGGELLTDILLREEPRLIEIWEEFLHGTQARRGIIARKGRDYAEIHVKKFMIRHRRMIGISEGDVAVLTALVGGN